jgi:hypothetical protein
VVLAPHRADPDHLTGVGAVVWELLDHPVGNADLDEAVAALLGTAAGVADSLAELIAADLVVALPDG